MPLASHYGAISGLSELGPEVIRAFVIPRVKIIGERIKQFLEGSVIGSVEKSAADHIKQLLVRVLAPVLKASSSPPDNVEEYKNEFGYLGSVIHNAVVKARLPTTTSSNTRTTVTVTSQSRVLQANPRTPTIVSVPRQLTPSPQQKILFLASNQRSATQSIVSSSNSTPTLVKFVNPPNIQNLSGKMLTTCTSSAPVSKVVVMTTSQNATGNIVISQSGNGVSSQLSTTQSMGVKTIFPSPSSNPSTPEPQPSGYQSADNSGQASNQVL